MPRMELAALVLLALLPQTLSIAAGRVRLTPHSLPYRQVMRNVEDVQYVVNVTVGHQVLRGVLDTGSFELLVFSQDCPTCGKRSLLYNHSLSPTHVKGHLHAVHSFGSGQAFSVEAWDDVAMGPLQARRQNFWEVTRAGMPVLQTAAFQAIIGVGPPNGPVDQAWTAVHKAQAAKQWFEERRLAVPKKVMADLSERYRIAKQTSVKDTLLQTLGVNLFSICLQPGFGADGYFAWNDDEPAAHRDRFVRIPVMAKATWGMNMSNVRLLHRFGKEDNALDLGCRDGCGAIADSGTSLLAAPQAVIDKLQEELERLQPDCSNLDQMPDLVFSLGGHEFTLPPDAYVGQISGDVPAELLEHLPRRRRRPSPGHGDGRPRQCELLLMKQDTMTQLGPMWILGMPFFRKYYTAFDLGAGTGNRSLLVARADPECRPADPKAAKAAQAAHPRESLLGSQRVWRTVSGPKLRLPTWAAAAQNAGTMDI